MLIVCKWCVDFGPHSQCYLNHWFTYCDFPYDRVGANWQVLGPTAVVRQGLWIRGWHYLHAFCAWPARLTVDATSGFQVWPRLYCLSWALTNMKDSQQQKTWTEIETTKRPHCWTCSPWIRLWQFAGARMLPAMYWRLPGIQRDVCGKALVSSHAENDLQNSGFSTSTFFCRLAK